MLILNFFLKIFGLISISTDQYKEYLFLKNNPTIIPMFGPPEKEFTEIFVTCKVLAGLGVTTSRLKGSAMDAETYNEEDFVFFIKDTLLFYGSSLELNNKQIQQLHSIYNLTKDITIVYKDFKLSLNIKFVTSK